MDAGLAATRCCRGTGSSTQPTALCGAGQQPSATCRAVSARRQSCRTLQPQTHQRQGTEGTAGLTPGLKAASCRAALPGCPARGHPTSASKAARPHVRTEPSTSIASAASVGSPWRFFSSGCTSQTRATLGQDTPLQCKQPRWLARAPCCQQQAVITTAEPRAVLRIPEQRQERKAGRDRLSHSSLGHMGVFPGSPCQTVPRSPMHWGRVSAELKGFS